MIAECGKIGSNINQIAKHLNIGNPMEARLIEESKPESCKPGCDPHRS